MAPGTHPSRNDALQRLLAATRTRLTANVALHRAGLGMTIGAAIALTVLLIERLAGIGLGEIEPWWFAIGPVSGAMAGAASALFTAPTPFEAATHVDVRMRTRDRIATAEQLAEGRVRTPSDASGGADFSLFIEADAARIAAKIDPRTAVPLRITSIWQVAGLAAVALAATAAFLPSFAWARSQPNPQQLAQQQQLIEQRDAVADDLNSAIEALRGDDATAADTDGEADTAASDADPLRERLDALDRIAEQLAGDQPPTPEQLREAREQAAAEISEAAEDLERRARTDEQARDELARRFERWQQPDAPLTARQLAEKLRNGEFGEAAEAIERLLEERDAMTEQERRALADSMRSLSEAAEDVAGRAQRDAELAERIEQLRDALREQGVDEQTIDDLLDEPSDPPPTQEPPADEQASSEQTADDAGEQQDESADTQDDRQTTEQQSQDANAQSQSQQNDPVQTPPNQQQDKQQQEQGTDASAQDRQEQQQQQGGDQQSQQRDPNAPSQRQEDAGGKQQRGEGAQPQPGEQGESQQSDPQQPGSDQQQQRKSTAGEQREQGGQQRNQPSRDEIERRLREQGVEEQQARELAEDIDQARRERQAQRRADEQGEQVSDALREAADEIEPEQQPGEQPRSRDQQPQNQERAAAAENQQQQGQQQQQKSGEQMAGEQQQQRDVASEQPGQPQHDQPPSHPEQQPVADPGQRKSPAETLRDLQRQREQAERNQQDAQRLRDIARRMAENMSPEERQRWMEQFQREQGPPPPSSQGRQPQPPPGGDQADNDSDTDTDTDTDDRGSGAPDDSDATGSNARPGDQPGREQAEERQPGSFQPEGTEDVVDDADDAAGRTIAELMGDGNPQAGEPGQTSEALARQVREAGRVAERAVNESAVPRRYHDLIRRYFGRVTKKATAPEGGESTPAPGNGAPAEGGN